MATASAPPCVSGIRNAALLGQDGKWDIRFECGKISSLQAADPSQHDAAMIDAKGNLVIPGFVDPHIHLDKALIHSRCACESGDFPEALKESYNAKRSFSEEDISHRAKTLIEDAISFGTTLLRTHCEVDDVLHLKSVRALLALREEYKNAITIQICAFAQEGITNIEGEVEWLREAMRLGCDVIASAPYCDPNPEANISQVFDLAQEFDKDVDFHLDYHLSADKATYLQIVLNETIKRNWQGRVCLGHMTALSSLDPTDLATVIGKLQSADVAVLALPASDVYMMARADTHDRRRGVCPVNVLARSGIRASFGTNNVQNLFTFTGDGDILKIATLLAQLLQLGSRDAHRECLSMATTGSAKAIGVSGHQVTEGAFADLVILECPDATVALAAPPATRTVFKRGRMVAQSRRLVQRWM